MAIGAERDPASSHAAMSLLCRSFTLRMYSKKRRQAEYSGLAVWVSTCIQPCLEDDLPSQLHNSSGTGLCNLAEVCVAESVAHRALARTAGRGSRRIDTVLRVVKAVERLQPELETYSFRKLEHLA